MHAVVARGISPCSIFATLTALCALSSVKMKVAFRNAKGVYQRASDYKCNYSYNSCNNYTTPHFNYNYKCDCTLRYSSLDYNYNYTCSTLQLQLQLQLHYTATTTTTTLLRNTRLQLR